MKKKMEHTKAPKAIGEAIETSEIITDFLPPPEQLILKEDPTRALTINASQESIETWANRPYITYPLREKLVKASTLIVPSEGFGDQADLVYFPEGTEKLLNLLRESDKENVLVDICIEDQDYKELALHSDLLIIADIVATYIAAPLIVQRIAAYIKQRVRKHETDTEVKSTLTVYDENTDRSAELSYEGPAADYHYVMTNAVSRLGKMRSSPLWKPAKRKKKGNSKRKKSRK